MGGMRVSRTPLALWQFLGSNEKRAPAWWEVNVLWLGAQERGMVLVGECARQPVAWRFGAGRWVRPLSALVLARGSQMSETLCYRVACW